MAQHILEIDMNKSAYVDQLRPKDNFGTGEYLYSGDRANDIPRYLAALGWDVSLIPVRKKITKAQVWIWKEGLTGTARSLQLGYNIIQANWDETTLTWNNKPFPDSVFKYLIGIFGSESQGYIVYDIDPADIYTPYGIVFGVIGGIALIFNSTRAYTNKPYLRIIYEDVPPDPPTPLEPINRFVNNQEVIRFSWQYNSSVGGEQKSFELQWSTDQVNWTTISKVTPNTYYDMPAKNLPSGNIYWRVRCFNEYGEASLFSDIVTFIAVGPPPTPVVQVLSTNTARPTVSWTAFEQQVYQLQVLSGDTIIYDSGIVPGINIRQHKIKAWLEDGEYTVQLRIKNEYDLWSEWSSAVVTISTDKPAKPTLTAQKTSTGIKLTISGASGRVLIYRDGVCIGSYPERQITNLLGEDGDFEDVSKWFDYYTTHELDTSNKIHGDSGMKITISGADGGTLYTSGRAVDPLKYYMVSMYLKNVNSTAVFFYVDDGAGGHAKGSEAVEGTTFTRTMIKLSPSEHTNIIRPVIQLLGSTGQYAYVDAAILTEITEEDYNNLTDEQLLAKYPFGNNTFMAPAIEILGGYVDNAVANGKEYSYTARVVFSYPERQITNLLGEDGDCEDTSKWSVVLGNLSLDATNKVFGSNAFKLSGSSNGYGHIYRDVTSVFDKTKNYILSAYLYKGTAISSRLRISDGITEKYLTTNAANMTRCIVRVPANTFAGDLITVDYIPIGDATVSGYIDAIMLCEVSGGDLALTDAELLAKYPFGNNTFMAPAIETFTDSDPVTATAEFSHALIAPVSDLSDVFTFSRSLNTPPKRTYNLQPGGAFVEYAGRKHPVWEPTEHVSAAWTMSFFLKSWAKVEAFIDLVDRKETVLYRDGRGRKIYGVLGNLSVNDERGGYSVSFTLTEVDHSEGVEV